jgi:alpha-beta hydrolase superfamily lysophospholipase
MIKVKKERIFGICSLPFKKAKGIPLILTHGSGDNSSQYPLVHLSKFLTHRGYLTVRFDFRGCGNSDGKEENYSLSSQIKDLEVVINFIERKTGKKVGIIAKSISCVPSFIIASKRKDIAFMIALGAPYNIRKYWSKEELEEAKKRGYIFYKGFKYGWKYGWEMLNFQKRYKEALKRVNVPVLLLNGEKDEKVSLEEAKAIFSALGSKEKKLEVIKNSDHSFKLHEENLKDLEKSILAFMNKVKS